MSSPPLAAPARKRWILCRIPFTKIYTGFYGGLFVYALILESFYPFTFLPSTSDVAQTLSWQTTAISLHLEELSMCFMMVGLTGASIVLILAAALCCWTKIIDTTTAVSDTKQKKPAPTAAPHRWISYAFPGSLLVMMVNGAMFNRDPELPLTEGAITHVKDTFLNRTLPLYRSVMVFYVTLGIFAILLVILCFTIFLVRARYRARSQTPDVESQAVVEGYGAASSEKHSASVGHLTETLPITEKIDDVDSQLSSSEKRESVFW